MDRGAERVLFLDGVDPPRFRPLLRDFFLVITMSSHIFMRLHDNICINIRVCPIGNILITNTL